MDITYVLLSLLASDFVLVVLDSYFFSRVLWLFVSFLV
jgi:hypothetical protein